MALRRSTLRSSVSLAIALVLVATASAGALAVRRGSANASATSGGTDPAAPAKRLANAPKFTTRPAGVRPSVNVRQLAAKKPTVRQHRTPPFLSPEASTRGTTPSGGPKTVLAVPPAPVEATSNGHPTAFKSSFDGLAQTSSAATAGEPPDPWVAVGPEHIVQAVNLAIRITDRQGTMAVLDVALPDFFQLPAPGFFDSDPHVIYDSLHGRWLATEVSWDCFPDPVGPGADFGHGYLDFAVSRTTDPTGTWDQGFITFNDQLPDYPAPGTTTDKIGFASNMLDMAAGADCLAGSTYAGGDVVVLDWADVLNLGTLTPREAFFPATDLSNLPAVMHWFTPRVAVQVPATSSRMHIVIQYDFGTGTTGLGHLTVVGSATGILKFERIDNLTDEYPLVSGFVDPIPPRQPGSPGTIVDAVDSRPTDAIWQGNRLVLVSTAGCTPATDTALRDCVRVTELDTSTVGTGANDTATLRQDFLVTEIGRDIYMGGVGLSGDGTLHVAYTRSSNIATDYPVARTRHQLLGDPLNSVSAEQNLAGGAGTYPGTRWGDYVGVAQDPQVPNQAWDGNEGSAGATGWVTKISRLQTDGTTYVPVAPVRVLDTRVGTGLTGMFTSSNARSWQVAGVLGIPAEAVAVTGNVTVVGQTSSGFVSVTVTSTNTPPSSTINFPVGETRANNVTTALSPAGRLSATFKGATGKKTHLLFDVTGYFLADNTGGTFTPVTPFRALDTRTGAGLTGKFVSSTARKLQIGSALGPVPLTATAITGNLTVVGPSKAGFASVTKTLNNSPTTSTINFPAGAVRANGVFAPLDTDGSLWIVYKSAAGATSHFLLDVTGYFEDGILGLKFVPLNPSRIMDSRPGVALSGVTGAFTSGSPKTLDVQGHWGAPASAVAVTGNLTVTGQTAGGFVSATPDPEPIPATSTINFPMGDTLANGIVAPLNVTGESSFVYKSSPGRTTHLILDLSGYFE
ncbi:MAG: hypothetical protein ABI628_01135 [Chloroflexota bacterium]